MELKHLFRPLHGYEEYIFEVNGKEFRIPEEPSLRFRVQVAKCNHNYRRRATDEELGQFPWRVQTTGNFFGYEVWCVNGDEEYLGCESSFDVPFDEEEAVEIIRKTYVDAIHEYALGQRDIENSFGSGI